MDKLDAMQAFAKVVALGSYAEAGRQLGLTRSAVSKGAAAPFGIVFPPFQPSMPGKLPSRGLE